jgi:two-component system, NtrC family, sensor kinase
VKLTRRLTLWFLLAIGSVFAVNAVLSVRQHLSLFDADLRRDERLLGRALAYAVEQAWRDHGPEHALDLVKAADVRESQVRFRIVWLDAPPGSEEGPAAARTPAEVLRRDRTPVQLRDARGDLRFYTYVPLDVPGPRPAALELSESLADERAYIAFRVRETLASAAILVLVAGAVAFGVGILLVGRPVRALVAKARRIGSGDFSGPLVLPQRDELAQLADELNTTAERLDLAARKVAAESEARIAALAQLRHADRLTTVGKLASGLAHELGTPLGVVSGRAQMIAAGEVTGPEDTARAARIIGEQAECMTRLVRQLLDFARWRSGERRLEDAVSLARQTVAMLAPLAARRGAELRFAGTRDPVLVRLDASQLQQALANLVVNAIHATPRGGAVDVSVEARARAEGSPGRPPGRYAVLVVDDEGEGIPTERLPAIFDPFFTTKPVGEGTGLGLSVAHGIVQEHGGFIEVQSEPARGSRFEIWLPREADA